MASESWHTAGAGVWDIAGVSRARVDADRPTGTRVRTHGLRHSAITAWLNSGVLPKTAQEWSGHNRLSVVLDTYVG